MLHTLIHLFSEILAPRSCAACEAPRIGANVAFCVACAATLVVDGAPSSTHRPHRADESRGRAAFARDSASDADVAAFEYGGALAVAIRRFKYGETDASLGPVLGALACRALPQIAHSIDVVTHVPLHPRRLVERGFDQAALLGRVAADHLAVPMAYGALKRTRDTAQQASLGRVARLENVRGAFALARAKNAFAGKRVLLVDDVRTTGATLDACARVLREAGASRVSTLVLARDA